MEPFGKHGCYRAPCGQPGRLQRHLDSPGGSRDLSGRLQRAMWTAREAPETFGQPGRVERLVWIAREAWQAPESQESYLDGAEGSRGPFGQPARLQRAIWTARKAREGFKRKPVLGGVYALFEG